MSIESKLAIKNLKMNNKRNVYIIISIILCTFLILTTVILTLSIRNGINSSIENSGMNYHFVICDLSSDQINLIQDKEYVDKIYIQKNNEELQELKNRRFINVDLNSITVYIKFVDANNSYRYATDLIQTLDFSKHETEIKCSFNESILTSYGLIGENLVEKDGEICYTSLFNFSYIINFMIAIIIIFFSILSITVLYNGFLISFNERKKEYAVLNSIGCTDSQLLKILLIETLIISIFGICIGVFISILGSQIILNLINSITNLTIYSFSLNVDIKFIVLSVFIIILNIFIATLILVNKMKNTSTMEEIQNNKQIKYKSQRSITKNILPIEARVANKNIKRNKNKFGIITFMLVICMVTFISIITYINYERETEKIVGINDVDAEMDIYINHDVDDVAENEADIYQYIDDYIIDFDSIINKYIIETGYNIDYIECIWKGFYAVIDNENAIDSNLIYDNTINFNGKNPINIMIIGLDDKTYKSYLDVVGGDYGDKIIYNIGMTWNSDTVNPVYSYYNIFTNNNFNLSIIDYYEDDGLGTCNVVNNEDLNGNIILTDKELTGFAEFQSSWDYSNVVDIYVNMDTFNKVMKSVSDYENEYRYNTFNYSIYNYDSSYLVRRLKISAENIINFSNYMDIFIKEKKMNDVISMNYFSLDRQEKIIFIDVVELIMNYVIFIITLITIISMINLLSASLHERSQEFKTLNKIGATRKNINRIIIYENLHILFKAMVISIIISTPIVYLIIKYVEKVIVFNQIFVPFGKIFIFFITLILLFIIITLFSTSVVMYERKNQHGNL